MSSLSQGKIALLNRNRKEETLVKVKTILKNHRYLVLRVRERPPNLEKERLRELLKRKTLMVNLPQLETDQAVISLQKKLRL